MNLTEHFTLEEAIRSNKATELGINNRPGTPEIKLAIIKTAEGMEMVREVLGAPIIVSSWYRGPKLNDAVGGRATSQHCKGEAVDFICPKFGNVNQVFDRIKSSNIQYDQLIVEKVKRKDGTISEWIHISFSQKPRLMAMSYDGSTYTRIT
jgi:zinc D-Ala-D-Ala carboxypeptidase